MNTERYQEAVRKLKSTIRPHALKGYMSGTAEHEQQFYLDRTAYLLKALGNPEKNGFKVIHVAGTSGKGSTSIMIYESLVAEGVTVGMFNSPYVTTSLENIHVNGLLADIDVFIEAVHKVVDVAKTIEKKKEEMTPSYSEIFFAVALEVFSACGVEWVVAETGCGGRFDYTRSFPDSSVAAAVLTPIAIDHTIVLGDTLKEIAWHKAGIIRKGIPTISAIQHPTATTVIDAEIKAVGSDVAYIAPEDTYETAMPGQHQQQNAAVAAGTCALLGASEESILAGIARAQLPARIETIQENTSEQPMVIIDGAHSEAKISALVETVTDLQEQQGFNNTHILFSAKDGKDIETTIKLLAPIVDTTTTTGWQLEGFGSADPHQTAELFKKGGSDAESMPDFNSALDAVLEKAKPEDLVIITGSLYGAGFARERWISEDNILKKRTVFAK